MTMSESNKSFISEALQESGWQNHFAFPVASDENKYLINLLNEVTSKVRLIEEEAVEYKEKNEKLRTHLALVRHERSMTESILLERQRECDAVRHDVCLAEREVGRTKQDLRELKVQRRNINTRIGALENEIFVKSNELSTIRTRMECDQQLIDVYLDACEEDVRVRERLIALKQVDDSRFALLNAEAGRLSDRRRDIRKKLDTVVSKNDALRLRVAAASDRCRTLNQGRREVLHVWEHCVGQICKRDEDYSDLSKQYDEKLAEIREQSQRVEETKKLAELVQDDIKHTEKTIAVTNRGLWELRCVLQNMNDTLLLTADQLRSLQTTLERTESDHRTTVAEKKQLITVLKELGIKHDDLQNKVAELEDRYAEVNKKLMTVEQLIKMAEEKLAADERCQKQAHSFQKLLTSRSTKGVDEINKTVSEAHSLQAILNGVLNNSKGLKTRMLEKESELIKLDELIYKAQLYDQRIEKRIAHMETNPTITQEELNARQQHLRSLQTELDSRTKSCTTLSTMINQFMNDRRICKLRSQNIQSQLTTAQAQLDTAQLTMTNTKLTLKKLEAAWRERLVECNLNRHQVKRMEMKLQLLQNAIMGEEAKQLQLDALEKQMDCELSAHKDGIVGEIRQMESRSSEARGELIKRKRRLEQIKARYDLTVTAVTQEENDALSSRMRYLIKVLEDRQELKHRGDLLDYEVRQSEEELRALENTVVVMSSLNGVAREKVSKHTGETYLNVEKEAYGNKLSECQKALETRRQLRRKLRGNILHFEMQLEELGSLLNVLKQRCGMTEAHLEKAENAVRDGKQRYERTCNLLGQIMEKLNRFNRADQVDIDIRLLRDFNGLIYGYYERAVKNATEIIGDLPLMEQRLTDSMHFHKPSLFFSRTNETSRRTSATQERLSVIATQENLNMPVISIGENISFPKEFKKHQSK